jgi:predicted amidohydrolase
MKDLKIGIVQPDLRWEDKAANIRRMEDMIRSLPGPPDLVVLPEMFTTGFSMTPEPLAETMDGPTVRWMRSLAAELRVTLTGSLIIVEDGGFHNRLLWMPPEGSHETYDKRHLFRLTGEQLHYRPGSHRLIAHLGGWKVNLNVCYDLRFPVWSRQRPGSGEDAPEYDLLVYVANWPESRSHAWKTLLPARAVENQCYVVGVNRVGLDGQGIPHAGESMVVDPFGKTMFMASDREKAHVQTLEKKSLDEYRSRFPFWRDADGFTLS